MTLAFGDATCPHPRQLLARLTYEEFRDWCEYYELNPWGETRADLRQRVLIDAIGSQWAKDPEPLWPFYPYRQEAPDPAFQAAASDAVAEYLIYDETGKPTWKIPYEDVLKLVEGRAAKAGARRKAEARAAGVAKSVPSPRDEAL